MSEVAASAPAADTGSNEAASNEVGQEGSPQEGQVTKSMKEKFLLKVDGEEFEEEIDLSNKEELKKRLQLGHAAKKRMESARSAIEQANKERQETLKLASLLKERPDELLEKLGEKGLEAAKNLLRKKIEEERLTPQQREYRDRMRELESYKTKEKEREQAEAAAKADEEEKYHVENYQKQIIEALGKSKMGKHPKAIAGIADLMLKGAKKGIDLSTDEVAEMYKDRVRSDLKDLFSDMSGEDIIETFGDELVRKIRKADISRLESKRASLYEPRQESSPRVTRESGSKALTMDEWRESINKRVNG